MSNDRAHRREIIKVRLDFSIIVCAALVVGPCLYWETSKHGPPRSAIIAMEWLGLIDTAYAPGFSETKFESVKLGDDAESVVTILGTPIDYWKEYDGEVGWCYSMSPSSSNYVRRVIMIDVQSQKAVEKVAELYWD